MKYLIALIITGALVLIGIDFYITRIELPKKNTLRSVLSEKPPVIDGMVDDLWQQASTLSITLQGGANSGKHLLQARSVYDGENIYFLFEWNDPDQSEQVSPWQKQADGSWKRLGSAEYYENNYAEDMFALIWAIRGSYLANNGCAVACHQPEPFKEYGSKYSMKGELADLWQWRATSTNPIHQMDNRFIDDSKYSPQNRLGGLKYDYYAKNGPDSLNLENDSQKGNLELRGWEINASDDRKTPRYMPKNVSAKNNFFLAKSDAVVFRDTFKTGDLLPSIVVQPVKTDDQTISAYGIYANGQWHLEIAKKRLNDNKNDIQFPETGVGYLFAPAIFDNSNKMHSVSQHMYQIKLLEDR